MKNSTQLRPALLVCLMALFSSSMFAQSDMFYAANSVVAPSNAIVEKTTNAEDVEKLEVTVAVESDRAKIEWVSNSAHKSEYFEIQKLDVFTNTYETIATVKTADAVSNFYYDNAPIDGENYYRVKTVYTNNSSRISEVNKVAFNSGDKVKVATMSDALDIDVAAFSKDDVFVSVFNGVGQNVTTKNVKKGGDSVLHLNTSAQTAGDYYLRVSAKGKHDITKRISIKH